jgi:hypothetical protein
LSVSSYSGSGQQWTTTEGFSTSIESSIELGANFLQVFSASVFISVAYESTSYAETLTFDPSGKCDWTQHAIMYMYPLFDKYLGYFTDNPNEDVEWFVPVASPTNHRIEVECLG